MRKRILGIVLAASVGLTATIPAHAETSTELSGETSISSELSSQLSSEAETEAPELEDPEAAQGSSEGVVLGVVAILAVGGLIAGGVHWAIQERIIPNPLPGIIPGPPAPQRQAPAPAPQQQAPAPAPQRQAPAPAPPRQAPAPAPAPANNVYYRNCTAVWNALNRPIKRNDAGYRSAHDRDNDGIGCEYDPR